MTYVAIFLALLGLFLAWRAQRNHSELRERIAQVNSRVYNLRREMQEQQERARQELVALKFELLKSQGKLAITPDMKIGEVVLAHPQARQILAGFHLGGCSSCAVDEGQTLGEAAAVNGRELEPMLAALNTLVAESQNGNGPVAPERLKTPNVQLQF
jgi:hybrid cluster-associated redox disulfide protein